MYAAKKKKVELGQLRALFKNLCAAGSTIQEFKGLFKNLCAAGSQFRNFIASTKTGSSFVFFGHLERVWGRQLGGSEGEWALGVLDHSSTQGFNSSPNPSPGRS